MITDERNEGFPPETAMLTSQPLSATSDAPPVDVAEYNYALIYRIVLLSMREFLSVPREGCSPPPCLSLTPFLSFLLFRICKCQLAYICVGRLLRAV